MSTEIITVEIPWMTLHANNSTTSNGFTPGTGFIMPAGIIKQVRVRKRLKNVIGNIQIRPMIEMWNNERSTTETPGTKAIGSFGATLGLSLFDSFTDVSADVDGYQFVRFGWETKNSSGTDLSVIQASAVWEIEIYKNRTVRYIPHKQYYANSVTAVFYPSTKWFSTSGIENFRGALEVRSISGDFEVQLGYQLTNDRATVQSGVGFGDAETTEGLHYPSAFAGADISGYSHIRFGVLARVTTSGNCYASVAGQIEIVGAQGHYARANADDWLDERVAWEEVTGEKLPGESWGGRGNPHVGSNGGNSKGVPVLPPGSRPGPDGKPPEE